MDVILIVAVAVVACVAAFLYLRGRGTSTADADSKASHAQRGGNSLRGADRGVDHDALDDDEDDDEDDDGGNGGRAGRGRRARGAANEPKLSRLQRKKLEKEKEKEARREAVTAAQEARHRTQEETALKEDEEAAQEAERAALEEAALQELRDEKKRREDEEYARWVGTMGVEESGELGDEQRKRHERMVAHLRSRYAAVRELAQARIAAEKNDGAGASAPVDEAARAALVSAHQVILYDTAKEVGVTVEQLVTVIEQLVREETISGVFDEHGKFILLAEEHYPLIAKFIQQRGRVSVVELARECNQIILQA